VRLRPDVRTGDEACPVTTLRWYFLDEHETLPAGNPCTALMAKSITKAPDEARATIREQGTTTVKAPNTR